MRSGHSSVSLRSEAFLPSRQEGFFMPSFEDVQRESLTVNRFKMLHRLTNNR